MLPKAVISAIDTFVKSSTGATVVLLTNAYGCHLIVPEKRLPSSTSCTTLFLYISFAFCRIVPVAFSIPYPIATDTSEAVITVYSPTVSGCPKTEST